MFNINDFLVFIGEPLEAKSKYTMAAAGVLSHVESVYKIKLESLTETFNEYSSDGSTVYLEYTPITTISSVKYDGEEVEYTFKDNKITLTTSISDTSIPLVITATMGYTTIPNDLKYALYAHIQSVMFVQRENIANVSKTVNSTGNSTFYRDGSVPSDSLRVYNYYSKRQLLLYG